MVYPGLSSGRNTSDERGLGAVSYTHLRIHAELLENPALEEGREESAADELSLIHI